MAMDHALLRRAARTGESVARVYAWSRPTLSFGRNQIAAGAYDPDRARALGVEIVRRPTGGRALLHHRELTYSVTVPAGRRPRALYALINRVLLDALRHLGVDATIVDHGAPPPTDTPCFDAPSAGELVVGGRKLAGSAQAREAGALLQHGSILIDDDQPLIDDIRVAPSLPPTRPATLRAVLGRAVEPREFAVVLAAALGVTAKPWTPDATLLGETGTLRALYADPAWTWRR
jgi:lipoate-protein ligase A